MFVVLVTLVDKKVIKFKSKLLVLAVNSILKTKRLTKVLYNTLLLYKVCSNVRCLVLGGDQDRRVPFMPFLLVKCFKKVFL